MKRGRRSKILTIFLSLALAITMIPMMTGIAFADGDQPVPQNMRWDGSVAKWDPVDGVDRYFIYLAKEKEGSTELDWLNNGSTYSVDQGTSQKDFTREFEHYGAGKYTFNAGYWMNGKDYYFDENGPYLNVSNKYLVNFDANGGSGTMKQSGSISGYFELPDCTFTAPTGKQFKGWGYTATGDAIEESSITLTTNITLYAIWQDKIPVTKIKLNHSKLNVEIGKSENLKVSFEPERAFADYEWTSSNPNISIQMDGKVTVSESAKDGESATITVRTTDGLHSDTCIVTAKSYKDLLNGNHLRWDGTVAKWDPVDGTDRFFIYLAKKNEETGELDWLNNGSTYSVDQGSCEKDFTDELEYYGVGDYIFNIGFWMDGRDYYFDVKSPELHYKGPHVH
ncbi:MAG: InlB B-repeat-containing protein, partial [Eubacteriales bacterium]|nr:InlB B-repeat-containing protein [Eubacteriales bacterium]